MSDDTAPTVGVNWTTEKNLRRCELVDREIEGTLSAEGKAELEQLQAEMLAYRRKIAPLTIDDLRKFHAELLKQHSQQTQ